MKAKKLNSLLLLFVAPISAQKERLYPEGGNRKSLEHSEMPSEINISNENNRDILMARTEISGCGIVQGGSIHHHAPCDENVVSTEIENSDTISTRYDDSETNPSVGTEEILSQPCVSSDGIFGEISDNALATLPITYHYEMQTVAGTSAEKINNVILPELEKVIVESILHEVFPEECTTIAFGKRKQRKLDRSLNDRLDKAIGVSMYPPDYITTNICNILTPSDSSSECHVLKGELTIYFGEDQMFDELNYVDSLIKENMNSGVYNTVREEIVQLYYFEKLEPTESNTSEGSDGNVDTGKRNNRTLRMGLFVGIGALAAVFAGIIFRVTRKMRNNDDQTEIQTTGAQPYPDVERQRPSFD